MTKFQLSICKKAFFHHHLLKILFFPHNVWIFVSLLKIRCLQPCGLISRHSISFHWSIVPITKSLWVCSIIFREVL